MSLPLDLPDMARMKVHLRVLALAGRTYRVVTLRPSARVRYSTNYYHDTWHIVSDIAGARVLARLLWGLAYQKQLGTLVLLAEPHLVPTPFDGARSDPVVLVPAGLTPVCHDALRALKARLRTLGAPTQTIRWHTFGLDREIALRQGEAETDLQKEERLRWTPAFAPLRRAEQMSKRGGFVCYTAPPLVLRSEALMVHRLYTGTGRYHHEMDYHFLVRAGRFVDGEVQVFHDYRERVSAATVARRQVLARTDAPTGETLEEVVSGQREAILRSRRRQRTAQG